MAATTTPDDAYRFAKGETVISVERNPWRGCARPLDWLVVADHAENPRLVHRARRTKAPCWTGTSWAAGLAEIFAPRDATAAMGESYIYWTRRLQ